MYIFHSDQWETQAFHNLTVQTSKIRNNVHWINHQLVVYYEKCYKNINIQQFFNVTDNTMWCHWSSLETLALSNNCLNVTKLN